MPSRNKVFSSPLFAGLIGALFFTTYQIGIETNETLNTYLTIQTGVGNGMVFLPHPDFTRFFCRAELQINFFGIWVYHIERGGFNRFEWEIMSIWLAQKFIVFLLSSVGGFAITRCLARRYPPVYDHWAKRG